MCEQLRTTVSHIGIEMPDCGAEVAHACMRSRDGYLPHETPDFWNIVHAQHGGKCRQNQSVVNKEISPQDITLVG